MHPVASSVASPEEPAIAPSSPAISPAVVVPATTPLAGHFRVREGKPLLVEWVGPDAQSCPLCPARPVGRNCYAMHMSRRHQGEMAITSRERFAAAIEEEGSAGVRWVGFAPTRIPQPTEAMSRLVPAPFLATYASLAVEDWVRYALLFGGVPHFCRGRISRLCRQTGRIFLQPRGETEECAIPLDGLEALELLDAFPLGSCVRESSFDKSEILAWLRPRKVGHTFAIRLRHGDTTSKWYGRLTTPRRAVLLASETQFLRVEINVDLASIPLMDVLSLDSATIPDFERVALPPPPPQPTYRTQHWTCGFFVEWVGGDGVSQGCPFCSFSCARLKNFGTHLREHQKDTRVVSNWLSWTGPRSCAEMRLGVCRGCGTHSNLERHIPRCQKAREKMARFRRMHATWSVRRFRLDGVAVDSASPAQNDSSIVALQSLATSSHQALPRPLLRIQSPRLRLVLSLHLLRIQSPRLRLVPSLHLLHIQSPQLLLVRSLRQETTAVSQLWPRPKLQEGSSNRRLRWNLFFACATGPSRPLLNFWVGTEHVWSSSHPVDSRLRLVLSLHLLPSSCFATPSRYGVFSGSYGSQL